ncbi:MAG: Na(+)/H(+) antiporter subunit D [Alphaproteobacteria bacterium]|nr:Na(+)/H(+) antiporter subunit D [Alphaproteobacteria bacterium]
MIGEFSPGLILIVGALLVPLLRGHLRSAYMLALPGLAFWYLLGLDHGSFGQIQTAGTTLVTLRVDKLSLIFGYIFLVAAFLGVLYALHVDDTLQHVAGLIYAGSAVGAVFAGDLITLFIFWEGTAIASVFLIWASRTETAYRAGLRYLVIQVGSGVLLLAGAIVHYRQTGSIAFDHIGLSSLASWLIFLSFGIKCAFPLMHNWLQDAYPEATVTGTVMLSAFTTKLAVYALARSYSGTEILVPIGAAMTAFPIFYAVIENDLRRVLAYSLNNQLGFMVVGIGIGTEMAINGTVAHAFSHILYKALLFMSMGAVLFRVGTIKGSELGGLYKSMPWTASFCIVGAASISSFPLFSGFISKALIISAAMDGGYFWTWLVLLFASAGVFHHSGIKIPYFAFFAHDSGKRCDEAPGNMLCAMAITAALCVLIGLFPWQLYALLPYAVNYAPYTVEHVVTQMQLLMFSALAFTVLMRTGIYPPELRSTNVDFDWFYRKGGKGLAVATGGALQTAWDGFVTASRRATRQVIAGIYRHHGPEGMLARTWPTGDMTFWTTVILAACLILAYF